LQPFLSCEIKPLRKSMDNLPPSAAGSSERKQVPPAAQQLESGVESAKKEAAKLKRGASEQATTSFENAKSKLQEVAQEASGYGQGLVNEQKNRLAEVVQEYRQAAQAASEKLRQEGHASLASRADEMVSRLDRASTYLRERKLSDIYYDAERLTRRRPEIVFGVMFAAGLVAARFLKASNRGTATAFRSDIQSERNLFEPLAQTSKP
jgi:gas vesicle protein